VLGLVHYRSGDKIAAQESWLSAVAENTDFVPALLAIAALSLEIDQPKSAEEFASSVVLEEPANLRALLLYARALAAQKRYPAAAGLLARAEAIDRNRPEPHLVAGDIALERGHFGKALVDFQKAVLLDPQSHEAVEGITRVYEKGRITRPMLQKMERVAGNPPPSAALMEVVGRLYLRNGWHHDAVRALERTLQIEEGRQSAATALVDAYMRTGQIATAAEAALRNSAGPAQMLAGVRAQRNNDVDAAITHFEAAVRQGDSTGYAANNLAWLYAQKGTSLDRALHLARTAAEARPAEAAIVDTLGMVHLKRREYSEAIGAFRRAVELAQNTGSHGLDTFRTHLVEAYTLAGQPDDAAAERAKAHGIQP
jgi:tetratricopeptide (TPR) repeat protein